ncbi:MAG: N-acetylmuramoyl-L-alanine amidase [Elusimicrobiota bacterium]
MMLKLLIWLYAGMLICEKIKLLIWKMIWKNSIVVSLCRHITVVALHRHITVCILFITYCLILATHNLHSIETKIINIVKENSNISSAPLSVPLFFVHEMGYLFVDDIAKIYHAKINWFPLSKKIVFTLNNKEIVFNIDSKKVIVDKIERQMNKPTIMLDNKLLVPLEFVIAKSFAGVTEFYTNWDSNHLTLRLSIIPDIFLPKYYSYKDGTRLIVQMVEKKEFQIDSSKEKKFAVKIYKSKIADIKKFPITVDDGVVDTIDVANLERDVLFTINLSTYSGKIETSTLTSPFRLVVDIFRTGEMSSKFVGSISEIAPSTTSFLPSRLVAGEVTNIPSSISPVLSDVEEKTPDIKINEIKKPKSTRAVCSLKKIVIDAGHGGHDPGAIGQKATREKNINLAIANQLASILKKNGYDIFMTRSDDTFVPLSERTKFANKVMADLFVSIHCNASISTNVRGFEIYFLSEKATDSAAEAVANMENSVLALEKTQFSAEKDIKKLLLSMAVNEFINESSFLCGVINQKVCKNFSNLDVKSVKQANFYILRGATMPAILVEVGFLSNIKEEKLLNNEKFQKKMAENIFNGIKEYEKRLK